MYTCTLELGIFTYRFSIDDLPATFKNYFSKRSDIHDYPTRHVNDLNLTNNKKSFSDHTVRAHGPFLWNSLPKSTKECKSVKHFRTLLKTQLLQTYE